MNDLRLKTQQWHKDRLITVNGSSVTQVAKLLEEAGELASGVLKKKKELTKDSIGDCLVVLSAICDLEGIDMQECWASAYEEIKDRKGYLTPEGNFIKEE